MIHQGTGINGNFRRVGSTRRDDWQLSLAQARIAITSRENRTISESQIPMDFMANVLEALQAYLRMPSVDFFQRRS